MNIYNMVLLVISMEIYIEKNSKKICLNIKDKTSMRDILNRIRVTPSSCIIVRNGKIILEDSEISQKDKIELLSVVSGG